MRTTPDLLIVVAEIGGLVAFLLVSGKTVTY